MSKPRIVPCHSFRRPPHRHRCKEEPNAADRQPSGCKDKCRLCPVSIIQPCYLCGFHKTIVPCKISHKPCLLCDCQPKLDLFEKRATFGGATSGTCLESVRIRTSQSHCTFMDHNICIAKVYCCLIKYCHKFIEHFLAKSFCTNTSCKQSALKQLNKIASKHALCLPLKQSLASTFHVANLSRTLSCHNTRGRTQNPLPSPVD